MLARVHTTSSLAREIERERETERETDRERERERERAGERVFILKGMTGALAPFSYLVRK